MSNIVLLKRIRYYHKPSKNHYNLSTFYFLVAGSKRSDPLLKVGLKFVSPDICNDTFGPMIGGRKLRVGITTDNMLCVGDLNGGKDTCQVSRTSLELSNAVTPSPI
jgi:hypothetical protein